MAAAAISLPLTLTPLVAPLLFARPRLVAATAAAAVFPVFPETFLPTLFPAPPALVELSQVDLAQLGPMVVDLVIPPPLDVGQLGNPAGCRGEHGQRLDERRGHFDQSKSKSGYTFYLFLDE